MLHELKIRKCFFDPVLERIKTFEIRRNNDRGFQAGDEVLFHEVSEISHNVTTGRQAKGRITYVLNYEQKEDYVVFAFELYGAKP
ncbi:DUF3850 domain-containing protein [Pseudomonas sp. OVF7]|uniref:DUF3850 domain-containing protein n=1 Tax=unclassified Pseudomonas TaxID=196821 RepID=UPI00272DB2EE|nr:DUF3850 domain-containing protein [Pseudomonas sp. OVF7]WLD64720.1 DUF3850 domain-containing protein [Pseudomonas sp. OVF7]